jgi:hypothetical protein
MALMSRGKLLVIWFVCVTFLPLLMLGMLGHILLGSKTRALNMSIALDACLNAETGGDPKETVSTRTGNALIDGKRWARIAAPVIDFFFGRGHCLEKATRPLN